MNFEEYLISFLKQVNAEDIEDIIPLLIINGYVSATDYLDLPNEYLSRHCDVIVEAENFQVVKEKNGKRYFVEDYEGIYEPLTQVELLGTRDIPSTDFNEIALDEFEGALFCGEIIDSTQVNEDGEIIITVGWFG